MNQTVLIAFSGKRRIAQGEPLPVALAVKAAAARHEAAPILVFDSLNGKAIDLDLRGTDAEIRARLAGPAHEPEPPRGPGRPRLGVVAREVTLLPRHWEWLSAQPGGASVALRKLVDEARRTSETTDRVRIGRENLYRFMSAIAGDEPLFEEASRALFAGEAQRFRSLVDPWPADVREHILAMAQAAF